MRGEYGPVWENGSRKAYDRRRTLMIRYNISLEEYEMMLDWQGNRCAICAVSFDTLESKDIHVDHDHETGDVRGILCYPCNSAVERLDNVPGWAHNALRYLAKEDASDS